MSWSKTFEKLEMLKIYFATRRGAGHTRALMNGVCRTDDAVVLVKDKMQADYIQRFAVFKEQKINTVTLDDFYHYMMGRSDPVVIDVWALMELFDDISHAFVDLRKENSILLDQVNGYKKLMSVWEKEE